MDWPNKGSNLDRIDFQTERSNPQQSEQEISLLSFLLSPLASLPSFLISKYLQVLARPIRPGSRGRAACATAGGPRSLPILFYRTGRGSSEEIAFRFPPVPELPHEHAILVRRRSLTRCWSPTHRHTVYTGAAVPRRGQLQLLARAVNSRCDHSKQPQHANP